MVKETLGPQSEATIEKILAWRYLQLVEGTPR